MTCCRRHGGNLTKVKAKAAQRLREATMPVLNSLIDTATQTVNLNAQVKAAQHVLNAAGIGAEIEARIRSSHRDNSGNKILVSIGFLSQGDGQPVTIEAPKVEITKE